MTGVAGRYGDAIRIRLTAPPVDGAANDELIRFLAERLGVPRSKVTEVAGRFGDAIRIRLAAPPVDGAANDELIRFLAERLGVPRGAIAIVRGATGRRKTLSVEGMTAARVQQLLMAES